MALVGDHDDGMGGIGSFLRLTAKKDITNRTSQMDEKIICRRIDFLRRTPLFMMLGEDDLRAISKEFCVRNYGT